MKTPWDYRFAQRTQRMSSSAIRELLKFTTLPDVISFAGGLPAPEVFPIEAFKHSCDRVLSNYGSQALQYSTTEGYLPLREFIAERSGFYDVKISPDNILITSGSQQALDLLGKILINPGDRILVESPTYLGAIQAWASYGAEYVTVPMDNHGMNTEHLEEALRCGPKLIYVLPNFQNPTGVTLALERREALIELADKYGVPIIEDDPYGQLRYKGVQLPSVLTLDDRLHCTDEAGYCGNVIYLSTFSKIMAPGIRLAWVIAPSVIIKKMVQAKQGADLHTSTFNQMVAYEVAKDGFLEEHIDTIREIYSERRNIMLAALDSYFPPNVDWTHPEGGLFLWGTLPDNLDAAEVLKSAVESKVAFVPGAPFFPLSGGHNTFRMNFSNASPGLIREGISRLGQVLKESMN